MLPLALLAAAGNRASPGNSIGLFTSLPIQWREAESIREHLSAAREPHWAMAVLLAHGTVQPVDSFMPGSKGSPLRTVKLLVMAQPRPLAPQENVELDAWVRKGGRLLLFADPMLTSDSRFSPGDARRPQDMVMLSPTLAHWDMRLEFDEDQPPGERAVMVEGTQVPVNLAGRLVPAENTRKCAVFADGIVARCAIGRGRVLVVADAALLEEAPGEQANRARALERLLALLSD